MDNIRLMLALLVILLNVLSVSLVSSSSLVCKWFLICGSGVCFIPLTEMKSKAVKHFLNFSFSFLNGKNNNSNSNSKLNSVDDTFFCQ